VSAALIPFLENDDANRALMGSNMMRQSVPLLQPEKPIVGTGMEATVAKDSRSAIASKHNGVVSSVDANHITIQTKGEKEDIELNPVEKFYTYSLKKFLRTNQNTCINQKPIVNVGDKIKIGDIYCRWSFYLKLILHLL
jgi:DNA-directed RNA polymerase subunit beta